MPPVEQQAQNTDNLQQEQQTTSWIEQYVPEDLRGEKTLEKFKGEDGIGNLAKSYIEMEKWKGGAIRIPAENASLEEVNDFRKKLGIPEAPEKYELKYKEHDALKVDETADKTYKELAHKAGLTPKQAQALADFDSDRTIQAYESYKKSVDDMVNQVKTDWGNEYQVKLDKANNVIRTFLDEKDKAVLDAFQDNPVYPVLARMFSKIGDSMAEHKFVPNNQTDASGSKAALQEKANGLIAIYTDTRKDQATRDKAYKEAQQVFEQIYGNVEVSGSGQFDRHEQGV
jgi:hypothetical protein